MANLEFTQENLQKVSKLIKDNLTPDLLPKKWIARNSTNPTFGHCHNAAGCLYRVFGVKNVKLYRGLDDEGIYHWWAQDKEGNIIDLTSEQYTTTGRTPPYDKGEKAGMLGFDYRKRVETLFERVNSKL
jgi:hypothetical protein